MKRRKKGIAALLTIAMLVVQITATTAYAEGPVPEGTTSVTSSTEETVVLKEGKAEEAGATQEPEKSEGDTQLYVSEEDLIAVNAATDESQIVAVQAGNANPANQPKTSEGVDVN